MKLNPNNYIFYKPSKLNLTIYILQTTTQQSIYFTTKIELNPNNLYFTNKFS